MLARMFRNAVLATGLLGAALALSQPADAPPSLSDRLGGVNRFQTHVSTDKPVYRGGEQVYVRGVVLAANTHKPIEDSAGVFGLVEIIGPKGDRIATGYAPVQDSVLGFAWNVPDEQPGGEYTARVSYPQHGYAPAERKFDIRAYRAPRLKSQIVFVRDGYGPGDQVRATAHVERAEGGLPAGAKVTAVARVDEAEVFRGVTAVDGDGNCTVSFKLPSEIARGEGTLALVIEDGGVSETAAKTIPILLQTLDIAIYPEGGDLVAGLPARVYIESRTPTRKPADIAGLIINDAGQTVAAFRTEHEGRGRVSFTPQRGESYVLQVIEPSGIATRFPLPVVKSSGAVIHAVDDWINPGDPVRLQVGSADPGSLTLTLTQREGEVAAARIPAIRGVIAAVTLTPPEAVDGVLIATVWNEAGQPLAERLLFRQPDHRVHVNLTTDQTLHTPGSPVKLTIKTTDDRGRPVTAVVGVTVTDDSVLEMIEKREQAPRLPVMVLLEPEVQELADAHVYLDESDPRAPLATDLLLGTQGWRRFAFFKPEDFLARHGDAARRVLALCTPPDQWRLGFRGVRAGGRGGEVDALVETVPQTQFGVLAMLGDKPESTAAPHGIAVDLAGNELAKPGVNRPASEKSKLRRIRMASQEAGRRIAAGELARERFDRDAAEDAPMLAFREYAHVARPDRQPGDRVDFTETLYWTAGVRTGAADGTAQISFALSDSVTTFRVFADAFDAHGGLGQAATAVESVEPFHIEPKLPLEVTAGDVVLLPVGLVSHLNDALGDGRLAIETKGDIRVGACDPFVLGARARDRRLIPLSIGHVKGATELVIRADAQRYADHVTRPLRVKPLGFPVEVAFGGLLGPDGAVIHSVTIPSDAVPASIASKSALYPTPLANLTEALARLIQEPNGCFEQTSSTTYPLTMAQQYFLSHGGVDPKLIEQSREKLEKGYARLVSFECKQHGYEWFGADPGHEPLSAYGLMHFADLAQVRNVDRTMVERTRQWLLGTRDGQGGFTRKQRALHTWIEDRDCSNGYILWALLEAGEKGLEPEVAWLKAAAQKSTNSYVLALAANVLSLAGDVAEAGKLMDRLAAKQTKDGLVDGATTSIVGSGGEALQIETTALATLAWLRDPARAAQVENAIRFLAQSCQAGRYGSTQSTVLALRAIVAYDRARAHPKAAGSVTIFVDGQSVGGPQRFDEHTQGALELPDVSELLTPGQHKIELRMEGGSAMPYSLAVNYHSTVPPSSPECKVGLRVTLPGDKIREGEITEASVSIQNRTDEPIPTPIAIIGLPGGLEPRHDQLKELVKSGQIDAYEVRGREVVLYWRGMRARQNVELTISLIAAIPGTYTGPASRAYLYYTDELKQWTDPLKVAIEARERQ